MMLRWIRSATLAGALCALTAPSLADTFEVLNLDDSGPGSLRAAILAANSQAGPHLIHFQDGLSGTILLAAPLPAIEQDVDIVGPGFDVVSVDGDDTHRVFRIESGTTVVLSGMEITGGNALFGGGISNEGDLTISDCRIQANAAPLGGGGGVDSFNGVLTIIQSIISENTADFGGGISISDGTATITDSRVSGNTASSVGGGIDNTGTLVLEGVTVSDNLAEIGGGIENSGPLEVRNATISGNSAQLDGGGLDNFMAEASLVHVTLAGNSAGSTGGGLWSDGTVTVKNSLVVESTTGGDCLNDGGQVDSLGNNLDTDGSCEGFDTTTPGSLLLGPLADNGGPTLTHALMSGSSAIDIAVDCTEIDGETSVDTDQRGASRPQGDFCDSGAFERQPDTEPPQAMISPGQIDLGDHELGVPSAPQAIQVQNSGGGSLEIGEISVEGSNAGDFAIVDDECGGNIVAAGESCDLGVVFTASAAGVRTARIRVPSNAPGSPGFVDLVGTHDVIFHDRFDGP